MRRMKWLLLLSVVAGCGGVGAQSSGLDITPISFEVKPGTEVQNCLYMKIPNDKDIDIGRVAMKFSEGTHHVQVYYSDEPHDDGMESCFQAVDFERWHLLAA